jgi:hypothetical protein
LLCKKTSHNAFYGQIKLTFLYKAAHRDGQKLAERGIREKPIRPILDI